MFRPPSVLQPWHLFLVCCQSLVNAPLQIPRTDDHLLALTYADLLPRVDDVKPRLVYVNYDKVPVHDVFRRVSNPMHNARPLYCEPARRGHRQQQGLRDFRSSPSSCSMRRRAAGTTAALVPLNNCGETRFKNRPGFTIIFRVFFIQKTIRRCLGDALHPSFKKIKCVL